MAKKASAGSVNKALIIREALTKGIESPSDIALYAKQSKGLEIDPKYVSVIKSQIRAKERGKVARSGGRDIQKDASIFALKCGTIDKAKKMLEAAKNDPTLAFAIAMGGTDRAIAALNELASHIGE
jgi:succinyl-CoA synthetase beta subunit